MKVKQYNDPWDYYVIDDFLTPERFDYIKKLAIIEKEYLDTFGFYSRSNHYFRFEKNDVLPEITNIFNELFPNREKHLKKINHWTIHPPNFKYNLHVDNKSRLYTAVLYIAPEENIGTFVAKNNSIFKDDHKEPEFPNQYEKEIEFKPNRLFLHKSEPHTWHSYGSSTERVTFNSFLVDPNLINEGRIEKDVKFHININ
jgi:hypothetical protein